jgi:hypothetical protein
MVTLTGTLALPQTSRVSKGNVKDALARIIREVIASDSHWCEVGCKSR